MQIRCLLFFIFLSIFNTLEAQEPNRRHVNPILFSEGSPAKTAVIDWHDKIAYVKLNSQKVSDYSSLHDSLISDKAPNRNCTSVHYVLGRNGDFLATYFVDIETQSSIEFLQTSKSIFAYDPMNNFFSEVDIFSSGFHKAGDCQGKEPRRIRVYDWSKVPNILNIFTVFGNNSSVKNQDLLLDINFVSNLLEKMTTEEQASKYFEINRHNIIVKTRGLLTKLLSKGEYELALNLFLPEQFNEALYEKLCNDLNIEISNNNRSNKFCHVIFKEFMSNIYDALILSENHKQISEVNFNKYDYFVGSAWSKFTYPKVSHNFTHDMAAKFIKHNCEIFIPKRIKRLSAIQNANDLNLTKHFTCNSVRDSWGKQLLENNLIKEPYEAKAWLLSTHPKIFERATAFTTRYTELTGNNFLKRKKSVGEFSELSNDDKKYLGCLYDYAFTINVMDGCISFITE